MALELMRRGGVTVALAATDEWRSLLNAVDEDVSSDMASESQGEGKYDMRLTNSTTLYTPESTEWQ